jgi:hypothetical protein
VALWSAAASASAGIVVAANRGTTPLALTTVDERGARGSITIPPGSARSIVTNGILRVAAGREGPGFEAKLAPYHAYFVSKDASSGAVTAARIPLGGTPGKPMTQAAGLPEMPDAGVITVKILVDDDEYRQRHAWEGEIRQRIERASAVLAAHAGVRLRVVAVETWDSNDAQSNFIASLSEFEGEVRPAPAQVAIGFSSQYPITQGRVHMGGTRGPLHSHILIKERASNILETERLELLVHELGHFLGATHTPNQQSVMRPLIKPGLQRAAGAEVRFDPANTLIISMVGEEIRRRGIRKLEDASPDVRRRLGEIYAALEPKTPNDPATGHMRRLVAAAGVKPVIEDAQRVLDQIVRVAKLKDTPAARNFDGGGAEKPLGGDRLTEFYVRQAAAAAKQVRRETAPQAFLLALAIAVDDPTKMAKIPVAGAVLAQIEGESQRVERLAAIGSPTMRGRQDMTRHFFVAAELVGLGGSDFARGAGLAKELSDSRGGTGFSFCDMAANEAGIRFAEAVLTGKLSLDDVAQRFTVEGFLPPVDSLPEKMQADEFAERFGGTGDRRYGAQMENIKAQIAALPGYAAASAAPVK